MSNIPEKMSSAEFNKEEDVYLTDWVRVKGKLYAPKETVKLSKNDKVQVLVTNKGRLAKTKDSADEAAAKVNLGADTKAKVK